MVFNKAFEQSLNRDTKQRVQAGGGALEFTDFQYAVVMCLDLHRKDVLKRLARDQK
jgi:hypothetical protein